LETLDTGYSLDELAVAREALRRHRADPGATAEAEVFFDGLGRRYA
jgi:hypothetical protein